MRAGLAILYFILLKLCEAQPAKDIDINTSCINMTPERAEEIKNISKEVTTFINALADKYVDIDFLVFEMKIENHSDAEEEEKETLLKILVNDCKANPLSRDDYLNSDDDGNDDGGEHKSTTNDKYDSDDKDVTHPIKSSDNESSARDNKEKNIGDNKRSIDKLKKETKNNTKSENTDPKPKQADLQNELSHKEVKVDDEVNGKESKLTINYNFNGNYDNANLYISPPKESQAKTESYEKLYKELYQTVLGNIKRNISPNNRNSQHIFEQPRSFGYHDNPNEMDDLWNVMMEKLRGETNPKNCVYALKKICGDFGENGNN